MSSRRRLLRAASGLAGAVGLAGCLDRVPLLGREEATGARVGPDGLPVRQHAVNEYLDADDAGNPLVPRYHLVLLANLREDPTESTRDHLESAMETLDAAHEWGPRGLFHRLAWGTDYFERIGSLSSAPVRRPSVISRTDDPELLGFDAALVLSSDVPSHLTAAEAAMFGDRTELNGVPVDAKLGDGLEIVQRRTGFIGEGLPAKHADVEGIPEDSAITGTSPMFTGFFSGREKTQATEDRVTIQSGDYAGGTTVHLSHLRLSLDEWFGGMDEADRVARMFSPRFGPGDVDGFDTDVPVTENLSEVASQFDLVGHQEKVAQTREDGRPVILRRDFNTVDGGHAGLHFLSLQRSLDDFVRTRDAMNGWWLRDESPAITDRENNGLLNFVTVRSRANFYLPPRDRRVFPGL